MAYEAYHRRIEVIGTTNHARYALDLEDDHIGELISIVGPMLPAFHLIGFHDLALEVSPQGIISFVRGTPATQVNRSGSPMPPPAPPQPPMPTDAPQPSLRGSYWDELVAEAAKEFNGGC